MIAPRLPVPARLTPALGRVLLVAALLALIALVSADDARSPSGLSGSDAPLDGTPTWYGVSQLIEKDFPHTFEYGILSYADRPNVPWTVRTSDIWLSVLDHDFRPAVGGPRLRIAPNTPDVLKPKIANENADLEVNISLILERNRAKADMYTLRACTRVHLSSPVRGLTRGDRVTALYEFYMPPAPDREPSLVAGQRFMVVPSDTEERTTESAYRGVKSGRPVVWEDILAKLFTLKSAESENQRTTRYVFALEGFPEDVYVNGRYTVTTLPHLTPLLDDDNLRMLKAKYEGKQVWCYGGPVGECIWFQPDVRAYMGADVTVPVTIRRIERVREKYLLMGYGAGANDPWGDGNPYFNTTDPLVVIIDAPIEEFEPGPCYSLKEDRTEEADRVCAAFRRSPGKYCTQLWWKVADAWDFERRYHLQPPWQEHPEWPTKMLDAIKDGCLVRGMTPEMVVWVWGWPAVYGDMEHLKAFDEWGYTGLPAKEPSLVFRKGRFVEIYDPPSP